MPAKLTVFIGLPASGKSTEAAKRIAAGKGKVKRVERDALRRMLDDGQYTPKNEKIVAKVQKALIELLLDEDLEVIVSDTNLHPNTRNALLDLAMEKRAIIEQNRSFLEIPVEECIKRDLERQHSVGEQVIRRMYHKWVAPFRPRRMYEGLPNVILCDLDGTLADMGSRNPYDASTCEQDTLRTHVAAAVKSMATATNAEIVLFSGRHDTHREQTERWLAFHGIPYAQLQMRPAGDNRPDTVLKRELFETHLQDKYNVVAVFDDRPSVVRLWRSLGLPVFDVGEGVDF